MIYKLSLLLCVLRAPISDRQQLSSWQAEFKNAHTQYRPSIYRIEGGRLRRPFIHRLPIKRIVSFSLHDCLICELFTQRALMMLKVGLLLCGNCAKNLCNSFFFFVSLIPVSSFKQSSLSRRLAATAFVYMRLLLKRPRPSPRAEAEIANEISAYLCEIIIFAVPPEWCCRRR